jgi:hypothetical protein
MGVLLAGVVLLGGCQKQLVAQREDNLAAAGFIVKPANTPERKAMLARLPAHHFVRRDKGDAVHYVYADPLVCGCLYVGSQTAYDQYRSDQQQQRLADEQQMTAQSYEDGAWDWNQWGPGFGFNYGPGVGW